MAQILYGALFLLAVPAGLGLWARALAPAVPILAVHAFSAGMALAAGGLALLVAGIATLMARGRGLPMNAFPPPVLVRSGIFGWIRSPIYIGFGLIVTGVSLATGSAAGLWIVAPVTALAMAALVFGFERHDLRRRFGEAAMIPPRLSLPRGGLEPPTAWHRVAVFLWVLIPWLGAYFSVQALGRAPDAFELALPWERHWPVWQWTELIYASTYLFIPLIPLLIRTQAGLRQFAVSGAVATMIVTLCWLVIPVVATNRPFQPAHALGRLLAFEQGASTGVAAFPAFHVLWTLLGAEAWASNARSGGSRWWGRIGWSWAVLITLSTLTTGMHTVIEVGAAIALFPLLRDCRRTWEVCRRAVEHLANSWKEWRVGRVRIINHGVYAAAAAGIGLLVAGTALGREWYWAAIWVSCCILIGAGALAQWLEGSSQLLRPFGWYGGVLGGVLGGCIARLLGVPLVPLLASFVIAAPWIQIFGRLRCLVQGCCHGGPAAPSVGICYRHPRSRVTGLAGLGGVPIHPTPLYSIAGNLVLGVVLIRLRILGAPDALVLGGWLMLSGIARFVEESYRAEPQTRIVGGLRIYQWFAITSVVAGILCTLLPPVSRPGGFATPTPSLVGAALAFLLIATWAMGVDFPESNRRFSRLAPAD